MPIISVPGHGNVEFPDNMSDEEISAAIKRNSAPGYPAVQLPQGLQNEKENFFNAPGFGVTQAIHGAEHMAQPGLKPKLEGAHQVVQGGFKAATPFVAPAAVMNPIGLGLGIAGGYAAGKGIRGGLELAGAPPEVKDIGEDVGNIFGGGYAGTRPKLGPAIGAGVKAAAPDVAMGGSMIGAGELLGKVPGMTWPARIGLGYPGAHQIAHGIRKGFGAATDRFNRPDVILPSEPSQPGNMTAEQVTKSLPPASPQEAASQNTHTPGTTQADEFRPPVVKPPTAPPMQTPPPGSVQPPVAGPQTPQAQPFSPVASSAQPTVPSAPKAVQTPTNSTVEMPKNTSVPKGGQEFPGGPATESAVDVIRPGTAPPGEEMIPRAETLLDEQAKKHAELVKLFEEFKKRHSK